MTLHRLTSQEIEELKTVGIIAQNWYAVSYNSNSTPIAIFSNEEYAIAYRDKFTATSIVEPWPMIVRDYRKAKSSKGI